MWVGLEERVHHWRQGLEEGERRRGRGGREGRSGREKRGEGRGEEGERRRWRREMKREIAGGIEARQRGESAAVATICLQYCEAHLQCSVTCKT